MGISDFSLEGKIALVTGGRTGTGKAIALTFAEAGPVCGNKIFRIGNAR